MSGPKELELPECTVTYDLLLYPNGVTDEPRLRAVLALRVAVVPQVESVTADFYVSFADEGQGPLSPELSCLQVDWVLLPTITPLIIALGHHWQEHPDLEEIRPFLHSQGVYESPQ